MITYKHTPCWSCTAGQARVPVQTSAPLFDGNGRVLILCATCRQHPNKVARLWQYMELALAEREQP